MSLFVSCNDIVADIAERISFAEHGKLVAESSEFHLTLSRAHKAPFSNSKYAKKAGRIAGKRDCAKKSVSLRPKAVGTTVDTYRSSYYINMRSLQYQTSIGPTLESDYRLVAR